MLEAGGRGRGRVWVAVFLGRREQTFLEVSKICLAVSDSVRKQ